MSLPELVRLAEEMEGWANTKRVDPQGLSWEKKVGMVAVELARGPGLKSPTVYLMTSAQLWKLFQKMGFNPEIPEIPEAPQP